MTTPLAGSRVVSPHSMHRRKQILAMIALIVITVVAYLVYEQYFARPSFEAQKAAIIQNIVLHSPSSVPDNVKNPIIQKVASDSANQTVTEEQKASFMERFAASQPKLK